MKINDIIITEEFLNEAPFYADWRDIQTAASSFIKHLSEPGTSITDVRDKIMYDRGVQLAARAFLEWWKRSRYIILSNPKYDPTSETTQDQLRSTIEGRVRNSLMARSPGLQTEINTILDAGDNLNSKEIQNAAAKIISSAVASTISSQYGSGAKSLSKRVSSKKASSTIDNSNLSDEEQKIINLRSKFYPHGEKLPDEIFKNTGTVRGPLTIGAKIFMNYRPGKPPVYFAKINGNWSHALPIGSSLHLDVNDIIEFDVEQAFNNALSTQNYRNPAAWYIAVQYEDVDDVIVLPEYNHKEWLATLNVESGHEGSLEGLPESLLKGPFSFKF